MVALTYDSSKVELFTGNLAVALDLVGSGIFVFPCKETARENEPEKISKAPYTPRGFHDSSDDPLQVLEWWAEHPSALVGIDCGRSGLVVVDLDCKNGKDGIAEFDRLSDGKPIGVGPVSTTQSGGQHWFFRNTETNKLGSSQGKVASGIDIRAVGGYVVCGEMPDDSAWAGTGWRGADHLPELAWSFALGTIPVVPDWLVELIRGPKRDERATTSLSQQAAPRAPLPRDDSDEERDYIERQLSHIPNDDREIWRNVGFALKDSGHPWAREVFDAWSRTWPQFNAADQERQWDSFGKTFKGNGIKMGTIIHMARQHGSAERKHAPDAPVDDDAIERIIENVHRRLARDADGTLHDENGVVIDEVRVEASPLHPKEQAQHDDAQQEQSGRRSSFKTFAEFSSEYQPLEYVIDRVAVRGNIYTLTARTGSGKTVLLSSTAIAIPTGRGDIIGFDVEVGRVAYLTFENPDDFRVKLIAAAQANNVTADAIGDKLIVKDLRISPEAAFNDLARERDPLSFIVVDTLQAAFDGKDFNDNKEVLNFISRLRRLTRLPGKPAVIVAAHPVKNAAADNLLPYGGGAILNEVDGNLSLARDAQLVSTLHWQGKFRGADFSPVGYVMRAHTCAGLLDSKGRPVCSPVIGLASSATIEGLEIRSRREKLAILLALHNEPGATVRKLAEAAGISSTGSVTNRLEGFERSGLVKKVDSKWVLTSEGARIATSSEVGAQQD